MRAALKPGLLIVIVFVAPLTAQTLVSVDPDIAEQGESLGIIVYGSGTHFLTAIYTSIWLSQGAEEIDAYGYYPYSNTELIVWFDIPIDAEIGLYDLNVYNEIDGTMTLYNCFTIIPYPALTSVTPDAAKQGQSLTVAITGVSVDFAQATWGSEFAQCTPTQGTPTTFQGTPSTVTDVWLSQGSSTIDWIRGWPLYDTLFYALFDIPHDAEPGKWDLHVEFEQCTPTTTFWELTIPDGFTIAQPGDVTCDGNVNVSDAVHIINYVFIGGFDPCDTDGDGVPDC